MVPGAAAEIVAQGNANVEADRQNEEIYVRTVAKLDLRGQWMAHSLTILFGVLSFVLFVMENPAGGVVLGLAAIAPIVRMFLQRGTSNSPEPPPQQDPPQSTQPEQD